MEKTITIRLTDDLNLIRNADVGDYQTLIDGNLIVTSYMKDQESENYAFLIAIHELIEQKLTKLRGIEEKDIDDYDASKVINKELDIPCPYIKEHIFSENIERQIAFEMGIDWNEYEKYYGEPEK